MKTQTRQLLLPLAAIALALATVFGGSARPSRDDWDAQAAKRKADYLYMTAKIFENDFDRRGNYEFLRRAYELDTTDCRLGAEIGGHLLMIGFSSEDEDLVEEAKRLMRRQFDANPEDFDNSEFYGTVCSRMGPVEESLRVWQVIDSLKPDNTDAKLRYADALVATGDSANLRRAIEQIDILERAKRPNEILTARRAGAYIDLGDTIAATADVKRLIALKPLDAPVRVFAGLYMQHINRPDSALVYLREAVALDPEDVDAFNALAKFLYECADWDSYLAECERMLPSEASDPALREYYAEQWREILERNENLAPRIEPLFVGLVEQFPAEVGISEEYVKWLGRSNRYGEAATVIKRMLALDPESPAAWNSLIFCEYRDGNVPGTIAAADSAVARYPDDDHIVGMAVSALSEFKEYPRALDYANRLVELTDTADVSRYATALGLVADILTLTEGIDSAMVYYERALELDPDNYLLMNNAAYFLALYDKQLDRAEQLSRKTIMGDQDNETFLDTYAYIKFKQRDYSTARLYIDSAISKAREGDGEVPSDLYEHAGDIYFMCGSPDEALRYWTLALEQDPENELLRKKVEHKAYFYE